MKIVWITESGLTRWHCEGREKSAEMYRFPRVDLVINIFMCRLPFPSLLFIEQTLYNLVYLLYVTCKNETATLKCYSYLLVRVVHFRSRTFKRRFVDKNCPGHEKKTKSFKM
jgi:hypothetical protein